MIETITVAGITFTAVKDGSAYIQLKSDNPAVIYLIGEEGFQYDPAVTYLVIINTILGILYILGLNPGSTSETTSES